MSGMRGHLQETVYCHRPFGFVDPTRSSHVCLLNKSLYGLKQAPRTWFHRFTAYLLSLGFVASKSDFSVFIYNQGSSVAYLLLYADDDIILTANTTAFLRTIITSLQREFSD